MTESWLFWVLVAVLGIKAYMTALLIGRTLEPGPPIKVIRRIALPIILILLIIIGWPT